MVSNVISLITLIAMANAQHSCAPKTLTPEPLPLPAEPKNTQPSPESGPSRQGGAITNYETGSFLQQHCLGNTNARKAFDTSLSGGPDNAIAKSAIEINKWVAVNDVNLGGFDVWTNCGKCVQVTAKLAQDGKPPISTTVGPLLIADRCSECPDAAIDLKSAAYKDLGIERGSVQPDQTDGGTTKMETSWHFVACGTPYKVIRE